MTVRIKVYGLVQGVFFRHKAKKTAEALGLGGWIRNNSDGSVEALAVGSRPRLEKFLAWCKKGPALASVERVEEDWQKQDEEFRTFEILR